MPSKLNDPSFNPTTNPHERHRQAQVARVRAAEQAQAQRKAAAQAQRESEQPAQHSVGGTRLDEETARLRDRAHADIAARHQQPAPAASAGLDDARAEDHADIRTLVENFFVANRERFNFDSEFNRQNFIQAMLHTVSAGLARWTTVHFERVATELFNGGYFEPPVRHRGEPAAKLVPIWEPTPPEPERVSVAEAVKRNRTEISAEENARLRGMSLEELRKEARAGFKPDTRNRVTRI